MLLVFGLPCALPALCWALRARSLGRQTDKMAEAWQYSHRAFCCCMMGLICFATFLFSFSFAILVRRAGCDCTTNAPDTTLQARPSPSPKDSDSFRRLIAPNPPVMGALGPDTDPEAPERVSHIYSDFTQDPFLYNPEQSQNQNFSFGEGEDEGHGLT